MTLDKKIEEVATFLGFEVESQNWSDKSKGWMRLRHMKATQEREWALIIYKEDGWDGAVGKMGEMLLKVGQLIKIQHINSIL